MKLWVSDSQSEIHTAKNYRNVIPCDLTCVHDSESKFCNWFDHGTAA